MRRVGPTCVTWGYRSQGCGHTADEQPFGLPAMGVALLESMAELRQLRHAAGVVAPSRWQRGRLAADGVPEDRITVISPPVHRRPSVVSPGGGAAPARPPRVVIACRLARFKGVHHLLEASARMSTPHEVDILGDGPARSSLEAQAQQLGINGHVRFHGRVDETRTAVMLTEADVVVVPSLWPETFGMSGAEAAAAGTRVVAYAHGGATEWLDPDAGHVAVDELDPNALARGLDVALAPTSAAEAPRSVRPRASFSVADHTDAIEALYTKLATGSAHV